MLQLTGAGKRFGHKLLFDQIDWMITPQDRIGLVGGNGTGKSTLLKILGGMEQVDSGSRSVAKGVRMGYLPQDGLYLKGRSVFQECMSVFDDIKAMEQEQHTLSHRLSEVTPDGEEYNAIANRLHDIESEFLARDAYSIDSKIGSVLGGLGFGKEDWDRLTDEFSGGWQMRIALAKLLLEQPNLLLLDEPTNHLDIEARDWLEHYLSSYPNAFVLISHDRYFLDVTVKKIAELWNKRAHFYVGNFAKYEKVKTETRAQLTAAAKNQQDRIEQLEAFINRFRAQATKAKQVQSRIKELEKIERIEIPPDEETIHFTFPQPPASGRIVAEMHGVQKAYGSKQVLRKADFLIERGERIALVGVNGAGKSTLIKLLAGTEPVTAGEYKLGHNVQFDHFAQDQYKELDPNAQMLEDLSASSPRHKTTELRSLLGCFLFSEDDVFKRIGVLSGGERNRFALAKILLSPSNFLLLDEPTNHLDMRAKDVLLHALQEYTGTVVFVSHDRYFLDNLATRVFEVADGEVHTYPGGYEDYLWRKQGGPEQMQQAAAAAASRTIASVNGNSNGASNGTSAQAAKANKPRVNPQRRKSLEQRAGELEQKVAAEEVNVATCEQELAAYTNAERSQQLASELETHRQTLDQLMAEWEAVTQELEALV